MSTPASPTGPGPAGAAETHTAWVFFAGDRAYKLKKPVDLGFLDFRSRATREVVCHREVELNRRLAPDVYIGVADLHGPGGELCDHLVVMRRMPPDRRLSALVAAGDPHIDDHLWHLAHLVAAFHTRAERGPHIDRAATAEALAGLWEANTAALRSVAGQVDVAEVDRIQVLAARYLAGRSRLFDRRIAEGRACDGHGDLLADDIFCLDDGPRVLDCIEFDDQLRYGDALADVAFLAMDLEHLGHPEAAARFLDAYREHADDNWPASLAHHHIAYRAQVRAKVAAIRADQGDPASAEQARGLLALARRHLEDARVRLVMVGGPPGTGKSTLAAGIGDTLGVTVLRSDELRKELAGLRLDAPATAPFGHGIYTPRHTRATYETMLGRAGVALGLGETVVLDASWIDATWRTRAREVARRNHADLVELRCELSPDAAAARMRARATIGADPSDAGPAIAATMRARTDPWPSAVVIDTSGDPAVSLAAALAHTRGTPGRGALR